jgi:Pectate lyase superfamily protein
VLLLGALTAVGVGLAIPEEVLRDGPPRPPAGGADPGPQPALGAGPVVNVRDLGATGDGRTDDGDAIRRGLAMVNGSGGTLFLPAGSYHYLATGPLAPATGVTIAGVPGSSTIALDHAGDFLDFLRVEADGVTVDGIVVRRDGAFGTVLLNLGAVAGFTLSRSSLVGHQEIYRDTICHGLKLADSGTSRGIRILDSTITGVVYGLLQDNESTGVVEGISVTRCNFAHNVNTDLEFNSPRGSIRQIRVTDCTFADNDSLGFGVGLAHVSDAEVRHNTFDRYALEAIHVEDYSESVTIADNRFTACGLRDYSHVQIISGSRGVKVIDNSFDASMNNAPIYLVNALPGGDWRTAGDRPPSPPLDVEVTGNRFECAGTIVPVSFEGVRGGAILRNTVAGPAVTSPDDAFRLLDDPGSAVSGNTINGQQY